MVQRKGTLDPEPAHEGSGRIRLIRPLTGDDYLGVVIPMRIWRLQILALVAAGVRNRRPLQLTPRALQRVRGRQRPGWVGRPCGRPCDWRAATHQADLDAPLTVHRPARTHLSRFMFCPDPEIRASGQGRLFLVCSP
jgi:hypothetical protein